MKTVEDCQRVMYNLIVSMSICDHLGDAWDDVMQSARDMGCELPPDYDPAEHTEMLVKRGYTGVRGSFSPEDFEEENDE